MKAGPLKNIGLFSCVPLALMVAGLLWTDACAEEWSELDRRGMVKTREILGNLKLKKFVPEDCAGEIMWYGNRVAVRHQRKLEFYNLPDGVTCFRWSSIGGVQSVVDDPLAISGKPVFRKAGTDVSLRPFKVVTFSTRIQTIRGGGLRMRSISLFAVMT